MKNWFKKLFLSTEDSSEVDVDVQNDPLEEVLYKNKKRQRMRESQEIKKDMSTSEREAFIEVKQRKNLNEDIVDILRKNGIEVDSPKQSKIRQLSQRSQQLSEEAEQLGDIVYQRHHSTRERSKISVKNLNEDMKKITPAKQLIEEDIFEVFSNDKLVTQQEAVVEIADEYIEQFVTSNNDEQPTLEQAVEEETLQLTSRRKSFMEEFGPKSDDEVPYYPNYKSKPSQASNSPHTYQFVHKPAFKPTTHFSSIHGLSDKSSTQSSTVISKSVNHVEYSSTGRIIKSRQPEQVNPVINGVHEPKTIAGLKQVEIKSPSSSHIPTSAISVSTTEVAQQPITNIKEQPQAKATPYNVLSSVEERARLRKLKRLGR